MSNSYLRKTIDVWRLYVNYGDGWEHETAELSRAQMVENRQS